jgi:hypothetical protein
LAIGPVEVFEVTNEDEFSGKTDRENSGHPNGYRGSVDQLSLRNEASFFYPVGHRGSGSRFSAHKELVSIYLQSYEAHIHLEHQVFGADALAQARAKGRRQCKPSENEVETVACELKRKDKTVDDQLLLSFRNLGC